MCMLSGRGRVFWLVVVARINVHACAMMCDVDRVGYAQDVQKKRGSGQTCLQMHACG